MTDPLLAGVRNGEWLDQQQFPPLVYAVPGVVPEGMTLLVGAPKIGKSWMVLGFALTVATGGQALGRISVEPRPVLYLALEDGDRRLQDRCRTLLIGDPIPPRLHYLTRVEPGKVLATVAAWMEQQQSPNGALVVLDTLGRAMPPALQGETTYQRDYKVGAALKQLIDSYPGAALVACHHDRKAAADDFVDTVSGTHGLAGAADTIVVVNRPRQEADGSLKVTGRDVAENEYAVAFTQPGHWRLDGDDLAAAAQTARLRRDTEGLGDRMVDVLELASRAEGPVTAGDVAEALSVPDNQARSYLSRAVDKGRLVKVERGQYAPPPSEGVASVAALRSDNDNATQQQLQQGVRGGEA